MGVYLYNLFFAAYDHPMYLFLCIPQDSFRYLSENLFLYYGGYDYDHHFHLL